MNIPKSLSDSSTSESEEDNTRMNPNLFYDPHRELKRKYSTDDSGDHMIDSSGFHSNVAHQFKTPEVYQDRRCSTDDTEDENLDTVEMPVKRFKGDFRGPARYVEREYSTDDSSDHGNEPSGSASASYQFKIPDSYPDRRGSTDDTEDENLDTVEMSSKSFGGTTFRSPSKYIERGISTDQSDSESDNKDTDLPVVDSTNGVYSVGAKMLAKMGYVSGTGLGKHEQGRTSIIETSKQIGRRGLGLTLKGLERSNEPWDSSLDQIVIEEEVSWIEARFPQVPMSELRGWMKIGTKKMTIDDETEFCDPEILKKVLEHKNVFNDLSPDEMRKARNRSNPFETIRGGIFLNRAAMKMANMDKRFDFMFTNPRDQNNDSLIREMELLYFADVCAGPGGFSEYVLWKKHWHARGFGFTLKGKNDFKLEDFFAGTPETFEPYYGPEENGDIYSPVNLMAFKKFVLQNTGERGVHFVMADGGFEIKGQENIQEILSKRLYLCQFLCALSILRPGGCFVCKIFDLFTPFSVGLVYLMCMAFEKVCIFKPNTSRPANSERYIVCKWLKSGTKDICDYMYEANEFLQNVKEGSDEDITEMVPLDVLCGNESFYKHIVNSNNKLGDRQIIYLFKIQCFARNEDLVENQQSELKTKCLRYWEIPEKARTAPTRPEADSRFKQLVQGEKLKYLHLPPKELLENNLSDVEEIFNYSCVVCGNNYASPEMQPTLFLSLGRSNVYKMISNGKWTKMDIKLEIPLDTLFYGEAVYELSGEHRGQRKVISLHLIDAIFLGGEDVRMHYYAYRMQLASKLALAVSKPSRQDFHLFRTKEVWQLKKFVHIYQKLGMKLMKNNAVKLCYDVEDEKYILPQGLLIMKVITEPWTAAFSKTQQMVYYFNKKTQDRAFKIDKKVAGNFQFCFSSRYFWDWEKGVKLLDVQKIPEIDKNLVQGSSMHSFIQSVLQKCGVTLYV